MTQTPYMRQLIAAADDHRLTVERLLEKYRAQPVGSGFGEIIVARAAAPHLIAELAGVPIAVSEVSWSCHCTPASEETLGCPHGLGGPRDEFGSGWYSEMCISTDVASAGFDLEDQSLSPAALASGCAEAAMQLVEAGLRASGFDSPCLTPGLELLVPAGWTHRAYQVDVPREWRPPSPAP